MRGFHSVAFFLSFLVILCFTGAVAGVTVAFVVAVVISFLYRKFTNTRLPVPPNAAVLITGTSAGIGLDAALEFAKLGFVVFAGVRKVEDGEALRAKAGDNTANIIPIILDVTKKEQIDDSYNTVKEHVQKRNVRLVAVINNAGYAESAPLEFISVAKLRKQFEVNLIGAVALSQKFVQLLRDASTPQHSSRLILISSGLGYFSIPYMAPYCASKFALEAVTDAWRVELKSSGIDVVNVTPGRTVTNFLQASRATRTENCNDIPRGSEIFRKFYQRGMEKLSEEQPGGVPVSRVSQELISAVLDSKPYPRYFASPEVAYGVPVMSQLPEGLMDVLVGKMFN